MRDYKVDAAVFFDCGWVFDKISDIEFDEFKEGYGLGLRFVSPGFVFTVEGAHSDEGTEFYAKFGPTF